MVNTIILPRDTVAELYKGARIDHYKCIEETEMEVDDKYQRWSIIIQDLNTGKLYKIDRERSGSPFTEYYYDTEYMEKFPAYEVKKVEKIVYDWVYV